MMIQNCLLAIILLATGWTVRDACTGDSVFTKTVHTTSGAHPASYSVCIGVLLRGYAAGARSSPSPLSSTGIRNEWSYTSAPPPHTHAFMARRVTIYLHLRLYADVKIYKVMVKLSPYMS